MKTIIAGSRSIDNYKILWDAIHSLPWPITEVVCGDARGVDRLGAWWAKQNGIPVKYFPADWETYGKRAGFVRNQEMAEYADALLAIWDGTSRGTEHMIKTAQRQLKRVKVIQPCLVCIRFPCTCFLEDEMRDSLEGN